MQIGFDAKRIFQNTTGLGNYARNLIDGLSRFAPEHHYHLFAPRTTGLFAATQYPNISVHLPEGFIHRRFKAYWRSKGMVNDLADQSLDLYHGLSFELPFGIERLKLPTIVSVHDLIFERYPEQYRAADVLISRKKTKHACAVANAVFAMSVQTKQDLIDLYQIPASKIFVTYQSCHDHFLSKKNSSELDRLKSKYNLPELYFLFVGSIIERKGLLKICEALGMMQQKIPLLVIGKGDGEYEQKVKQFITANRMTSQLVFLNETPAGKTPDFISGKDFPGIYQSATALVYPSVFEGFGIPVLEALSSGTAVITSRNSSMAEIAGEAALYIDAANSVDIAGAMKQVLQDERLRKTLGEKAVIQAAQFSKERLSSELITLYSTIIKNA